MESTCTCNVKLSVSINYGGIVTLTDHLSTSHTDNSDEDVLLIENSTGTSRDILAKYCMS